MTRGDARTQADGERDVQTTLTPQAERLLESVILAIPTPIAVWVWNAQGKLLHSNHFARDLFGLSGLSASVSDLQGRVSPSARASLSSLFPSRVFEGEVSRFDGLKLTLGNQMQLSLTGWAGPLDIDGSGQRLAITALRDTTDQRRGEALTAAEARVLELVASDVPLTPTLEELVRLFEAQAEGMIASILLVREGRVHHAAAPSLPEGWTRRVNGEPIGPDRGSCGAAAYTKEPVICTDIATDPRWALYRDAALGYGLRACWSVPVIASNGEVVGTFAFYYTEPREPTARLRALAQRGSRLASIAIQKNRHAEVVRQSREHLERFYENSADPVFQLDAEPSGFRFASVNPAFLETTGLTQASVVGRLVTDVIPEPSLSLVLSKYAEAVQSKRTVRWEETTVYPTGSRRGDVSVTPVFDSQGQIRHLIGAVRDVTEQARLSSEVHALLAREQLHSVLQVAPSNVAIVRDGIVRYANPRFVQTFGLDVGGDPTALALDPEAQRGALEAGARGESSFGLEFQARSANGEVLDLLATYRPIIYEDESCVLVYTTDVTPLKRAERQQQLLSERLQLATRAANVGVWTWMVEDGRVEWDEVMYRIHGVEPGGFAMTYDAWRCLLHPDDLSRVEGLLLAAREGQPFETEFRILRANGEVRYIRANATIQRDAWGETNFLVGTNFDITDEKAREAAVSAARDASDAANHAKSAFLANMSHEIRTPMNAILGFGQLLARETHLSQRDRERVNKILTSGEHLLELINQVLEMSKIEAGRMVLRNTTFDLYEALRHVEVMVRGRFEEKALSLAIEGVDKLPRFVCGDPARLRQMLVNLLGNAAKFTQQGGAMLRCSAHCDEDIRLTFEVHDSGVGIAAEDVAKVFEPFGQAGAAPDRRAGTGLGIPITRDIARLMHGDLTLRSELGVGSTFELVVHLGFAEDPERISRESYSAQVLSLADGQASPCVLVVDDNADNRLLLCEMLRGAGVRVVEAVDGRDAVERFFEFRPHLVFMDIKMPRMDGLEATRRIRARDMRRTPIVALSASVLDDERSLVEASGCDAFIAKPVRANEIWSALETYVGVELVRGPSSSLVFAPPADLGEVELAELDAVARAQLREAVELGDLDRFLVLVEGLEETSEETTGKLIDLAERYQIETLMNLL